MSESEALRKIFIGGLNWETQEEDLKDYFSQWGTIVDCVIMKKNGHSRGFGFVTYESSKSVDECLKVRGHVLDGREIEPKRSIPRDDAKNPMALAKTRKIFVGGLASTCTEDDVRDYFSELCEKHGSGKVIDVDLKRDKENSKRIRGFAFVTFDEEEIAEKVCAIKYHEIRMKQCEVKKAEPQSMLRKKEDDDYGRDRKDRDRELRERDRDSRDRDRDRDRGFVPWGPGHWMAGFFGGKEGKGDRDRRDRDRDRDRGGRDGDMSSFFPFGFNPAAFGPGFGFGGMGFGPAGFYGGFPGGFGPMGGFGGFGGGGGDRGGSYDKSGYGSGVGGSYGSSGGDRDRKTQSPSAAGTVSSGRSGTGSYETPSGGAGYGYPFAGMGGSPADWSSFQAAMMSNYGYNSGESGGQGSTDATSKSYSGTGEASFPMSGYSQMSSTYGPMARSTPRDAAGAKPDRGYRPY